MSEDWRIPVDIIGAAIKSIAKEGFTVEVRPGLEVDTAFGEPVILADGKRYGKNDIPPEIETELIEAANRHNDSIRKLAILKYRSPETNPLIRFDPDLDV